MKKFLIILVIGLAIGVRLYKLETSTHFLSDESRDLVNIHQIWVEKKITLVGPISDDRSHVFSSLTYYMLLPFAVIRNFDPMGTVIGAAFWGLATWIVIGLLINKINKRLLFWGLLLAAIWFPLVQISRWPWNPNLLIFWLTLGIYLAECDHKWLKFPAGLAMGLAVHHHYLALVPMALMLIKKRDILILLGSITALIPFVIFDWRHPPGIFVTRMIDYNRNSVNQNIGKLIGRLPEVYVNFSDYLFGIKFFSILGSLGIIMLAGWDFINKSANRKDLLIWIICLGPLVFYSHQFQYLLPAIPIFLYWLFNLRKAWGNKISLGIISLLIVSSILRINVLFNFQDWEGDLRILRTASKIMAKEIKIQNLINANVAVLGSPDIYPAGKKYRDLLLVDNIRLRTYEEYALSDNLFVVTKSDEETLRHDPAGEIMDFKNGPIKGIWNIPETEWKVIQFNKY